MIRDNIVLNISCAKRAIIENRGFNFYYYSKMVYFQSFNILVKKRRSSILAEKNNYNN